MQKEKKMSSSRSSYRKEMDCKLRESFARLKDKVDLIFKHIRLQHTCLEKTDQFIRLIMKKKITVDNADEIQFDFDKFCEIYEKTRRMSTISQTQVARSYFRDSLDTWFNEYNALISSLNLDNYNEYSIVDNNDRIGYEMSEMISEHFGGGGGANSDSSLYSRNNDPNARIYNLPSSNSKHYICTVDNCLMTFSTRQQLLSHQNDYHQNKQKEKVLVTKDPLIAPTIRLNHIDNPNEEYNANANNNIQSFKLASNSTRIEYNRKIVRNSYEPNPFITFEGISPPENISNNNNNRSNKRNNNNNSQEEKDRRSTTIITYSRLQPISPIVSSTIGVNSGKIFTDDQRSKPKGRKRKAVRGKSGNRNTGGVSKKKQVIPAKVLKPETPIRKNPGRQAKVDPEFGTKIIDISDDDEEQGVVDNSSIKDNLNNDNNNNNKQRKETQRPETEASADGSSENFMLKGGLDHLLHCSLQEADDNSIDLPW